MSRGQDYRLEAVIEHDLPTGVEHGELLVGLVDAVKNEDEEALQAARQALIRALGVEALVDAAAIIATFHHMDRVADGAGIPLDEPLEAGTRELRMALGLDRFASAANSPDTRR